MAKSISSQLLAHKSSSSATLCFLQKLGPLPNGGAFICVTSLDRDVVYDDGDGERTYYARTGTQLSNLSSQNDLTVNNGEADTLVELPEYPNTGITTAMVDSGRLDGVEFIIYQVNYNDLTMGHEIMGSGPVGEVRQLRGGLITVECRSWSDLLRQNSVCERDSLTCRVKHFGSQPGDELFPCMYDISGEWVNGLTVDALGDETVREFFSYALTQGDDYFTPGLVAWVTGDNAGMSREVEAFTSDTSGGTVVLQFTTRHAIQVGDTFNIRRDCSRKWSGTNSCQTYNNRPWFRGEPYIPVSDLIGLSVPGASSGGFQSGMAASS